MKFTARSAILFLLAAALVVALYFVTTERKRLDGSATSDKAEAPLARSTSTPVNAVTSNAPGFAARPEDAVRPVADRPRFESSSAPAQRRAAASDVDVQNAQRGLREYRQQFHQNPVGTNAEITRVLLGKNSRALRYLPEATKLNDKSELIDRWGQALFFHQISGTAMEIRSAGPDHVMWTADDEVTR